MQPDPLNPVPPRSTDWEKDGVGISEDGLLVVRVAGDEINLYQEASLENWTEAMRLFCQSKWTIEALERRVAAREPSDRLAELLKELRQRSRDADEMATASKGPARNLALGQAQAYAGVVGMIDRLFDLK